MEIEEYIIKKTNGDINYTVVSEVNKSINLAEGKYNKVLFIPATITENGVEWKIIGVDEDAFKYSWDLAVIMWNPEAVFNGIVNNPNLLLYVKDKSSAPADIKNVVVNGSADEIILKDAESGNNFYCLEAFTAKSVTYEHRYGMKSGLNVCQGWETIVLPFNVSSITNEDGKELVPYSAWTVGSSQLPFWLYSLSEGGWKPATAIKANTPYIICMPNNDYYDAAYNISGKIIFHGENVQIAASDQLNIGRDGNHTLVPNFQNQEQNSNVWALNVNNEMSRNADSSLVEGSAFVSNLRPVHPFEAYMTYEGAAAPLLIPVFGDNEETGIRDVLLRKNTSHASWYTLDGRKLQGHPTQKGLYIINGQKVVIR